MVLDNTRWLLRTLLLMALATGNNAMAATACGEKHDMAIEVLGTEQLALSGTVPAYLLWHRNQARVLVNAGAGATQALLASGQLTDGLDAILLTRLTADMSTELPLLVSQATRLKRKKPLTIYGPAEGKNMPSTISMVRGLFDTRRGSFRHLGDVLSPLGNKSYKLLVRDISSQRKKSLARKDRAREGIVIIHHGNGLMLKAVDTGNNQYPSLAWGIETGQGSIVVMDAPSMNNSAIKNLNNKGGTLIAHLGRHLAVPESLALTATTAAGIAYRAQVAQLHIAHMEQNDSSQQSSSLAEIKNKYAGLTGIVQPGDCIPVGKAP